MVEVVGLIIILATLGIGCWRFYKGRKLSASALTLAVLACFVGVALVISKRLTEFSFGKLATLKATVTQAQSDADEIAKIRNRVEAQAATMDLVAKESADAKRLLADLKKENAVAEDKLQLLEKKTQDFGQLPDGRIMTGGLVVGRASILMDGYSNLVERFKATKYSDAFAQAQDCIKRYEDTAEATKAAKANMGDVVMSSEGVQSMYEIAVKSALLQNEFATAATWAKAAISSHQSPEMNALLVLALVKSDKTAEANKLVEDVLKQGGADAERFQTKLREMGIVNKTP